MDKKEKYRNYQREYQKKWRKKNPVIAKKIASRTYQKHRSRNLFEMSEYRISKNGRYARYKGSAKEKGLEFELSILEFLSFWKKSCHYCGEDIKTIGLDRIDSKV